MYFIRKKKPFMYFKTTHGARPSPTSPTWLLKQTRAHAGKKRTPVESDRKHHPHHPSSPRSNNSNFAADITNGMNPTNGYTKTA
jgi:hypothetical protein